MKSPLSQRGTGAFTLVEMLCVIAIIGILAALLLPVLQKGKARAKLVGCQSHLGELGIAFHSFAHEHGSKFPMQTPVSQGGALEFVQNGHRVNGEFYFAWRIFQPLADDLVTPRLLVCPTDTRVAATNFISLRNKNLSYFVNVDADYGRPESVLLGDRNLLAGAGQSLFPANGRLVRWSAEMHQFKGNLLFADGHVEEAKGYLLANGNGGATVKNDLFLPSVKPGETAAQPALASHESFNQTSAAGTNSSPPDNSTNTSKSTRPEPVVFPAQSVAGNSAATGAGTQTADASPAGSSPAVQTATNLTASTDEDLGMSYFDRRAVKLFRQLFVGGYSLLLLLFLTWLGFKLRREWRRQQQRRQRKR